MLFSAAPCSTPSSRSFPARTAVITAGVVAAQGDLNIGLVILVAALGAFAGDNTAYWIGAQVSGTARPSGSFGARRASNALEWARKTLDERGGVLIVVSRFIPGGRIATMLTAGTVEDTRGCGGSCPTTRSRA